MGEIMKRERVATIALPVLVFIVLSGAAWSQQAPAPKTPYPSMAPVEQYMIANRADEIALARSAGPDSISRDAEVLVLGPHAYETAVKGTNGFVCIVERSWTAGIDDPDFWNPKLRGPLCLNAAAAQTYLPITLMKTRLVLAGKSKVQMVEAIESAFDKKELPALEPGAMCFMLSKQQYLGDSGRNWHPHTMFFVSHTAAKDWGANLPGSPILAADDPQDRMTIFMIPVGKWSDGTADAPAMH
jgi:hypothetical protein